jgi:hypothetical protein
MARGRDQRRRQLPLPGHSIRILSTRADLAGASRVQERIRGPKFNHENSRDHASQ